MSPTLRVVCVLTCGVLLLVGGFLYDALFAGIPFQDPTPALEEQYRNHARRGAWMQNIGIGLLLLSPLASLGGRTHSPPPPSESADDEAET